MSEKPEEQKWIDARQRVTDILKYYAELIGQPNVCPWFAISSLRSLENRYDQGERTQELFYEMMECE